MDPKPTMEKEPNTQPPKYNPTEGQGEPMDLNENIIKGKWREVKGEIQKAWGRLTDDELEKTKGDVKAIGGLIQQKYGQAQENSDRKLSEIIDRFKEKKDETMDDMKKSFKQ